MWHFRRHKTSLDQTDSTWTDLSASLVSSSHSLTSNSHHLYAPFSSSLNSPRQYIWLKKDFKISLLHGAIEPWYDWVLKLRSENPPQHFTSLIKFIISEIFFIITIIQIFDTTIMFMFMRVCYLECLYFSIPKCFWRFCSRRIVLIFTDLMNFLPSFMHESLVFRVFFWDAIVSNM